MTKNSSCPCSSTQFGFNFLAILLFFSLAWLVFRYVPSQAQGPWIALGLLITAGVLWIYDFYYLKVQCRSSTGLTEPGVLDWQRTRLKLIGLYGTFFIIFLLYRCVPYYHETPRAVQFYGYFFSFLKWFLPVVIILSLWYFPAIDRRQKDPYDSYWHMGCLLTGQWKNVNWIFIREHGRVWFIKAFFLPWMFGTMVEYLQMIFSFDCPKGATFILFYNHSLNIFYAADVIFGVLGYLLTLRINETHIQSTEPKILGWYVCLACYYPFALIGIDRLNYQNGFTWEHWFGFTPGFYYLCGLSIMGLSAIYGLATVAFGYRMSNLTYRGLITGGPYRFTKHPAYLSKVASWWLISLPFFSVRGPFIALKQTIALIIISYIYFLRAKTEENHLSNYPEYVQYAEWINDHGIFSPLKKWFPSLRYSAEKARRWNSVVWFKKLK